jgi:predicted RND superfamily exporter protein
MKIEQTPQVTTEMKHFENFGQTTEETTELEMMIREDRKSELRKLAHNAGLRHETYNLINKQFKREIARHSTKNITEKQFDN